VVGLIIVLTYKYLQEVIMTRLRTRGFFGEDKATQGTITLIERQCSLFVAGSCAAYAERENPNGFGSIKMSNGSKMTDDPSASRNYKSVTHETIRPLFCSYPEGSAEADYPPPNPTGTGWKAVSYVADGGSFQATPEHMFTPDYTSWPTPSVPSIDWDGMVSTVGSALDGDMRTKSNILVTLGEGMKTLAMLKSPLKSLRALYGSRSTKDVVHGVANIHLEYKYGWKQLYRDVTNFSDLFNSVTKHMEYLKENVGTYRPVSASQVDIATLPLYDRTSFFATLSFQKGTYKRTARFGCVSQLEQAMLDHGRMYHTLKGLGVDKVVEAAWDLIPYSFVVDWLINWKAVFRAVNLARFSTHTVRRMGYSVKEEWEYTPKILVSTPNLHDGSPGLSAEWNGQAGIVRTLYNRSVGFPADTETAGVFSTLSKTNLYDGAALILQRI
jgi:hypothetical protein